jgi:hypothetical protein
VLSERNESGTLSREVTAHIQKYFADYQRNSPADYKRLSLRQGEVHQSVGKMYAGGIQDENLEPAEVFSSVYLSLSNFVHGRYPETMDLYGGDPLKFQLRGMSGTPKDAENCLMLEVSVESVSMMLRTLTRKLELLEILKKDASLQDWFLSDPAPDQ